MEIKTESDVDSFNAAASNKSKGAMAVEASEDSSYDSDFENEDISSSHADISRTPSNAASHANASRCSSTGFSSTHQDVSRTVSDTLAEEFAEYVNNESANLSQAESENAQQQSSSKSTDEPLPLSKSSNYSSRVEFGLKLGYSERLVQTALQKLGPNPSQNELLGELIKLGAAQVPRSLEAISNVAVNDATSHSTNQELRNIIIDGSNVAMSHGNKEIFSCRGIKICVDWFVQRGHKEVIVFVPKWRKESSRPDHPISDKEILYELERERRLVFTPSRLVGGKRLVCYDDRYILKLAAENDGIVVSNDNYRDLVQESPDFRKVVEERLLMYSFVNDRFMPPDDPLGRSGPTLDTFLRLHKKSEPSICPYGKKCTYGNKCKFHHPERGNMPHKSVADRLTEHAQKQIQARSVPGNDLKTHSLPLYDSTKIRKMPLGRTQSAAPAPLPTDPHYHANIASHFNRAQLEHQMAVNKSLDRLPLGHNMDSPPKSHSIENITSSLNDMNFGELSPINSASNQGGPYAQQNNIWGTVVNPDMTPWMYMENPQPPEARNMHRKLQRQLTINPTHDPRLYRMHGCNQNLVPQPMHNQWSEHQTVSRISSAPAACAAWPPAAAPGASASEPRLHPLPPRGMQSQGPWTPSHTSHQEALNRMYYHLSSIFPEEQVQQAMAMFPDETNPQKICAAILEIFHKA